MNTCRRFILCAFCFTVVGCVSNTYPSETSVGPNAATVEGLLTPPTSTVLPMPSLVPSTQATERFLFEGLVTVTAARDWGSIETATGETLIAPNGAMTAEVRSSLCVGVEDPMVLHEIVLRSKSEDQSIAQFAFSCEGTVSFVPVQLLKWTEDSRYLFYTDQGGGGGQGNLCQWLRPAYRYEVASRAITKVSWEQSSYDGRYSAYRTVDELMVLDKSTGETPTKVSSSYPGGELAWVSWSPDDRWISYLENADSQCLSDGASTLTVVEANGKDFFRAQISQGGESMTAGSQVDWKSNEEFMVRTYGSATLTYHISNSGLERLDTTP